jgi:hypothetical protein
VTSQANASPTLIIIGHCIEAGHGEDHDVGRVVGVSGDLVTVAWRNSETSTTQPYAALAGCTVTMHEPD